MKLNATAVPRKRFFVEMFTRDVSVEDCVLDLIDNSVDGLIQTRGLDVSTALLQQHRTRARRLRIPLPRISVEISDKAVEISDNCGGISVKAAQEDVFNFGHAPAYDAVHQGRQLGAYGIGLKRAIFKLGRHFELVSRTTADGFRTSVDLDAWTSDDAAPQDWTIPIETTRPTSRSGDAGTTIRITALRPDVKSRLKDATLLQRLHTAIGQTYSMLLHRYVRVAFNGHDVPPMEVPVGESPEVRAGVKQLTSEGVKIRIVAGLGARDSGGRWRADLAGWYVCCNGRVIVFADKTELTGWGGGVMPAFHSKYRGFVGVAYFAAKDPLRLPWTTNKRGVNREAIVFQTARNQMQQLARPVLSFLDGMYASEPAEDDESRAIAANLRGAKLEDIVKRKSAEFSVKKRRARGSRPIVSIQYNVDRKDLDAIRLHLKSPRLAAGEIGRRTFDYYMEAEDLK